MFEPIKKQTTVRFQPDVLLWLKEKGNGKCRYLPTIRTSPVLIL